MPASSVVNAATSVSAKRLLGVLEHVAERTQQQSQRRAQLVADVGEEGRLGAVQLGEGLRA
jgi:hypothetical protein